MTVSSFLRQKWFDIVNPIGLASLVLSIYFYMDVKAVREPAFIVDPVRTEIIRADRMIDTPLKIVRDNGEAIRVDISSLRFFFWNRGKLPIKATDILEPLAVCLSDPQSEILDFKILKVSRSVVHPVIKRSPKNPQRALIITFDILESQDGFCCQIVFAGKPATALSLGGFLEGVSQFLQNETIAKSILWKKIARMVVFVGLVLLVFAIVIAYNPQLVSIPKIKYVIFIIMVMFSISTLHFLINKSKVPNVLKRIYEYELRRINTESVIDVVPEGIVAR